MVTIIFNQVGSFVTGNNAPLKKNNGKITKLEINPNPCISRGIMFDKMMREGKVDYVEGIKTIIEDMKVIY